MLELQDILDLMRDSGCYAWTLAKQDRLATSGWANLAQQNEGSNREESLNRLQTNVNIIARGLPGAVFKISICTSTKTNKEDRLGPFEFVAKKDAPPAALPLPQAPAPAAPVYGLGAVPPGYVSEATLEERFATMQERMRLDFEKRELQRSYEEKERELERRERRLRKKLATVNDESASIKEGVYAAGKKLLAGLFDGDLSTPLSGPPETDANTEAPATQPVEGAADPREAIVEDLARVVYESGLPPIALTHLGQLTRKFISSYQNPQNGSGNDQEVPEEQPRTAHG